MGTLGADGRRGREGDSPGTGLADPYPWTGKVLPQPLVVLGETAELKLGHGLLVRTRVHGSGRDGEQDAAAGSLVRRAREVEEREKGGKGDDKGWERSRRGLGRSAGGRKGLALRGSVSRRAGGERATGRTHRPVEDQRRDGERRAAPSRLQERATFSRRL